MIDELGWLRVGGVAVRVVLDDVADGWGSWSDEDQTIRIRRGLGLSLFVSTLAHELTHAAWSMYLRGTRPTEERTAQAIGAVLAENWRVLPEIIEKGADIWKR